MRSQAIWQKIVHNSLKTQKNMKKMQKAAALISLNFVRN